MGEKESEGEREREREQEDIMSYHILSCHLMVALVMTGQLEY